MKKPGKNKPRVTIPSCSVPKKNKARKKNPAQPESEDSYFNDIDKYFQANLAKVTMGISPAALATSYFSWCSQLAQSPGSLLELLLFPATNAGELGKNLINLEKPGGGHDVRFHTENWRLFPWKLWAELFLQTETWSLNASHNIPGLPEHVKRTVSFFTRQMLDAMSPSNFIPSNPDLLAETFRTGGTNVFRGTELAIQDMVEKIAGLPPAGVEHFTPGIQVAITRGKVVFSNHLIEVIQYEPQTAKVYKEPVLIIPAWIMKYYILDLLPDNSLVNWLTQQGHTVFIISWHNPGKADSNLGMDDYYRLGAMAAIDAVSHAIPKTKIHLMGYCLGGTLAMITASAMFENGDKRLKSLSLLAAQGDFTEAGELLLFITPSEISFLKNMMWEQGYLDTKQMAGSFQMLRSYDLIWSKMVQDYMHGTQRGMVALLAWNADTTRMPYKMHSEYLEKLFLNNEFSEGNYKVEGVNVVAKNIQVPAFVVSTEKDHVAPWKSVYKINLLINSDITFVLTNGGHNSGIVSEPGHPGHSYQICERPKDAIWLSADTWLKNTPSTEGSWWIPWHTWLVKQSSARLVNARYPDALLPNAPGKYVLEK